MLSNLIFMMALFIVFSSTISNTTNERIISDTEYINNVAKVYELSKSKEISNRDFVLSLYIMEVSNIEFSKLNEIIDSKSLINVLNELTIYEKRDFVDIFMDLFLLIILFISFKILMFEIRNYYHHNSYLLITSEAKEKYSSQKDKLFRFFSISGFLLAIISSVIATYIFNFFNL